MTCLSRTVLLNLWVVTQKWVADDCSCVKIKSLVFRDENREIGHRFKVKIFFLKILCFWDKNRDFNTDRKL